MLWSEQLSPQLSGHTMLQVHFQVFQLPVLYHSKGFAEIYLVHFGI